MGLNTWMSNRPALRAEARKWESEAMRANARVAPLVEKCGQLVRDKEALTEELVAAKARLTAMSERILALNTLVDEKVVDIDRLQNSVLDKAAEIKALRRDNDILRTQTHSSGQGMATVRRENENLRKEIADLRADGIKLRAEIVDLRKQNQRYLDAEGEQRAKVEELEEQVESLVRMSDRLRKIVRDYDNSVGEEKQKCLDVIEGFIPLCADLLPGEDAKEAKQALLRDVAAAIRGELWPGIPEAFSGRPDYIKVPHNLARQVFDKAAEADGELQAFLGKLMKAPVEDAVMEDTVKFGVGFAKLGVDEDGQPVFKHFKLGEMRDVPSPEEGFGLAPVKHEGGSYCPDPADGPARETDEPSPWASYLSDPLEWWQPAVAASEPQAAAGASGDVVASDDSAETFCPPAPSPGAYMTVHSDDRVKLCNACSAALERGWSPLGGVAVTFNPGSSSMVYTQAFEGLDCHPETGNEEVF